MHWWKLTDPVVGTEGGPLAKSDHRGPSRIAGSSMTRRGAASTAVLLSVACVAAACGSSGNGSAASTGGSNAAIDIGYLGTLSGSQAVVSKSSLSGAQAAVAQLNSTGGIDGHHVNLITEDDLGSTTTSVEKLRSLAGDGVKYVVGATFDPNCLSTAPIAQELGLIEVSPTCSTDQLTESKHVSSFFEVSARDSEAARASALFASEKYPGLTWQGLQPDFVFGHEMWQQFQSDLTGIDHSAKFGKNVYVPLDATQFDSYITSLISAAGDPSSTGWFSSAFGATMIGLGQQASSYNFFSHYHGVVDWGAPYPTYSALGASTPNMWFVYQYYPLAYSNATNTAFINEYKAQNSGALPYSWAEMGYTSVMAIAQGIEHAHSTDPTKVRSAMSGLTIQTPQGPAKFGKGNLLEMPVTALHVVGDNSAAGHVKVLSYQVLSAKQVIG